MYAYVWTGSSSAASWPGTQMTKVGTNSMNQDIYSITVDATKYQNIIFNNGSNQQTVDTTLKTADNTGYYLTGDSTPFSVETYTYTG